MQHNVVQYWDSVKSDQCKHENSTVQCQIVQCQIEQHQIVQCQIEQHQIVQHENSATSNSTILK